MIGGCGRAARRVWKRFGRRQRRVVPVAKVVSGGAEVWVTEGFGHDGGGGGGGRWLNPTHATPTPTFMNSRSLMDVNDSWMSRQEAAPAAGASPMAYRTYRLSSDSLFSSKNAAYGAWLGGGGHDMTA